MMDRSLMLLLVACLAYACVQHGRFWASVSLRAALAGFASAVLLLLVLAVWWFPTHGSYPAAENERIVDAAVEIAERDIAAADCVLVVDGSSIFTFGVNMATMRESLTQSGLHPCVLPLVMLGGEHFEREWMANRLRERLSETTRQRIDSLPIVWLKELHWVYDSQPMRFVASNADSDRMLSYCEPTQVPVMLHSLHGNWKNDSRSEHWSGLTAWWHFPWAQSSETMRHGVSNLFHVGQMQRWLQPSAPPYRYQQGIGDLAPMKTTRRWWSDHVEPDYVAKAVARYEPRSWLKRLIHDAPAGWPHRKGFELVLATAPSQTLFAHTYMAELAKLGKVDGHSLILPGNDAALRRQLNQPELWRDHIHLEGPGAVIFSRWLGEKVQPLIAVQRQQLTAP